jgi:hypothetical protein
MVGNPGRTRDAHKPMANIINRVMWTELHHKCPNPKKG